MAVDLSMSVLVVDDYNTMIRIIRNLLKQLGFENIDDASDGSAALNKMRGKKYGLVISDWNMEPMTGYDLLREVRADPESRHHALHHDHSGIQDRERDRRQEGRREQLYRQTVQRRHVEDQDRGGVSGPGERVSARSRPRPGEVEIRGRSGLRRVRQRTGDSKRPPTEAASKAGLMQVSIGYWKE